MWASSTFVVEFLWRTDRRSVDDVVDSFLVVHKSQHGPADQSDDGGTPLLALVHHNFLVKKAILSVFQKVLIQL